MKIQKMKNDYLNVRIKSQFKYNVLNQMIEKILKVPIIHNFLFKFYQQDHYYVIKELLVIAINTIMAMPKPDFKLSFLRQLSRSFIPSQDTKIKSNQEMILKQIDILKAEIQKLNRKNQEAHQQQQLKCTKIQNAVQEVPEIIQKKQQKIPKKQSNRRRQITPKITEIDYQQPVKVSNIKVQRHHLDDIQLKQILKFNKYLDCETYRQKIIDKNSKLQNIQKHLSQKFINTGATQIQPSDNPSMISTKRCTKPKLNLQSKIKDMAKIDKQRCQQKYHTQRPTLNRNQFSETFSPFDNQQDQNYKIENNLIEKSSHLKIKS